MGPEEDPGIVLDDGTSRAAVGCAVGCLLGLACWALLVGTAALVWVLVT